MGFGSLIERLFFPLTWFGQRPEWSTIWLWTSVPQLGAQAIITWHAASAKLAGKTAWKPDEATGVRLGMLHHRLSSKACKERLNVMVARRVLKTKLCNSNSLEDFVVTELRLERPRRGKQPRGLRAVTTVDELPRYLAEVVKAVAAGGQTTREFANRQDISIRAARELTQSQTPADRPLGPASLVELIP